MTILSGKNGNKNKNDSSLPEDIVGNIVKANRIVSFHPDKDDLKRDLDKGSVMHGYCTYCGLYPDYPLESAEAMAEFIGIKLPANLNDYYFKVNGCQYCGNSDDPKIELFPIPD